MSSPFGAPIVGRLVECKLCGALIRFQRHIHSQELAPFDPDPVPSGEWVAVAGVGYVHVKEAPKGARYFLVSHFGTCPVYLEQRAQERAARLAAQQPADQPAQLGLL